MGYIYKITNKITKQSYVGQTIMDLNERWRQHCKPNSNCRYLKSSIKKYGVDSFEFKLICVCFDNDLDKYECFYMNKYNTIVPNGYNLREGGNSGKHHEETKIKISETLKNRTDIIRGKPQLGKPHTEEIKNKISKTLTGRKLSSETKDKLKKINIKHNVFKIDKETGEILETFKGYVEAASSVQTSKGAIWKVCNGKSKMAKGFIWKSELISK
jgi:group I intron endonuclease